MDLIFDGHSRTGPCATSKCYGSCCFCTSSKLPCLEPFSIYPLGACTCLGFSLWEGAGEGDVSCTRVTGRWSVFVAALRPVISSKRVHVQQLLCLLHRRVSCEPSVLDVAPLSVMFRSLSGGVGLRCQTEPANCRFGVCLGLSSGRFSFLKVGTVWASLEV